MILSIQNRQTLRSVDTRQLRRVARWTLQELGVEDAELGIHLVGCLEMEKINGQYLNHKGSTDILTFDHRDDPNQLGASCSPFHGEMYICLDDTVLQARRHGCAWQLELARYVIHGLLHLRGHDDLEPEARKLMKREENRLLRKLASTMKLSLLHRTRKDARHVR
ncbi:MAG: rRNA maturation RNase YbeY [Verrucomicrobia bacterium]|nr:rRNA maturation RNase YbeY [Verrucomicrobiota bacterium]